MSLTGSKPYDGNANFASTLLTVANKVGTDNVGLTGTGTVLSANAANYTSFTSSTLAVSNNNYTLTGATVNVTINKKELTVTADNKTKTYGDASSAFTVSYSGFITGETKANLIFPAFATSTASATSPVGSYPITATGAAATNYSFKYVDGTLSVTPATLTVTAADRSKVYGATLTAADYTGTLEGVLNDDNITVTRSSAGDAATAGVNNYSINNTLADPSHKLGNYTVTNTPGTLSVTPATLTVTAADRSKVYGATLTAADYTGTLEGVLNDDNITVTRSSAGDAATAGVNNYSINNTLADPSHKLGNYTVTNTPGTLSVTPATLTVTAADRSKVYGATLTAADYTGTLEGVLNDDNITVTRSSAGDAATAGVNNYSINNTLADPSHKLGNYTVTNTPGTLSVTPATLTVTAADRSKVYGATLTAADYTGTLEGVLNDDNITVTRSSAGDAATAGVNNYSINNTLADPSHKLGNYTVTNTPGTLSVTPATLTVTAADRSKVYGATLTAADYTGTLEGVLNDDNITVTRSSAGDAATAGVNNYSINNTLADPSHKLGNYTVTNTPGTLSVTPATLTVTAADRSKVYGATLTAADYTGTLEGVLNDDNITVTRSSAGDAATAGVNNYSINNTLADPSHKLGNYTVTNTPGTLSVTPATLTVTAADRSKVYGATLTAADYTGTLEGVLNDDNITVTRSSAGDAATAGVNNYSINNTLADPSHKLGNYTVTNTPGTLSVTPATLTVTAADRSKVYGATLTAADYTGTLEGVLNDDNITVTRSSAGDAATAGVNNYSINNTLADPSHKLGNYTVTNTPGTLSVTPATLTVTAADRSKVYGATLTAADYTGTLEGVLNDDNITVTRSSAGDAATAGVNNYSINNTLADPSHKLGNYTVTNTPGTLSVTPATLTVTAADRSKVYGATLTAADYTGTLEGVLNDDNITVTRSSAGDAATAGVNNYSINNTLADPSHKLGNYTVTNTPGTLSVTPATLTVTAADRSKVYGATLTAADYTGTLEGVLNDDNITVTRSSAGDAATAGVNNYSINNTLADPSHKLGNYTVTNTPGTLSVTPATLTVTAADRSKVYGATLTAADYTGTLEGVLNDDNITVTRSSAGDAATAGVNNYSINNTLADPSHKLGNYTVTNTPGTLSVTPATLTVTAADRSKVYGATLTAADYTGTLEGVLNDDNITVTRSSAGDAATAGVNNYSINNTLADPSHKLGNYTVTNTPGTLSVTPATLTVTAADRSKVYGATLTAADYTGTLEGVLNDDNITVTRSSAGDAATAGVNNYSINNTLADPSHKLGNYTVTNTPGTLSVTPATLTVTAADRSKVYGATLTAADYTGTLEGVLNDDNITVTRSSAGDAATAGVNNYSINNTLADPSHKLGNYTVTNTPGTLSVTPATLTVTAADRSKVYGATLTAADYTGTLEGVLNDDNITVTRSSAGDAATAGVNNYSINNTLADPSHKLGNYTVTNTPGTLSVTPATLTVTAADRSKVYGATLTAADYTGTLEGVLNDDNITVTRSSAGDAATAGVNNYSINNTLADPSHKLGNYTVTNTPGTLSVTPATLTVTAADRSKVYGATLTAADYTGTLEGVLNDDNITVTRSSAGDAATAGVNNYSINNTLADPSHKLGNYTVTNTPGTLSVTPATLTVTAADRSKVYGATLTAADYTGTLEGVLNDDNITVTRSSAGDAATAGVNNYSINNTLADPSHKLGNYTVTNTPGTLSVTPATLTVTAADRSKVYGATLTAADYTGTLEGVLNDDNITVTRSSAGDAATAGVNNYSINNTLADPSHKLGNYTVTNTPGTLSVTPATLTVTAADRSKVYGATLTAADYTGTLEGVLNDDNITVTRSSAGDAATAGVNNYSINNTLADPSHKLGNYTVTNTPGTLSVTPATLTVTAADRSKVYGATLTAADYTGTLEGVLNDDNITVTRSSAGDAATAGVNNYSINNTLADPSHKLGNYTVTNTPGTLSVTPRAITVSANTGQYKFCGQNDPLPFGYTSSEMLLPGNSFDGALGRANGESIGTYAFTIGTLNAGNNYSITVAGSNTFEIRSSQIDASASSTAVPVGSATGAVLKARVTDSNGASVSGATVNFIVTSASNDVVGSAPAVSGPDGYATVPNFSVSGLQLGVYAVKAVVGTGCDDDYGYLTLYNQTESFVTGGGWIMSPPKALIAKPELTDKANFGFVSKYKKGSNAVDGNTEFQFSAGDFNFKSNMLESGTLVISSYKATYRGVGTVNGRGNYGFMVVAIDGAIKGDGVDKFRIKIWNKDEGNAVVYDNQVGKLENTDDATELGGGSIVIHEVKANGKPETQIARPTQVDATPAATKLTLQAYPNPAVSQFNIKLTSNNTTEKISLRVYNQLGQVMEVRNNLFSGQTLQVGAAYKQGTYFVEVVQGAQRERLQLVKTN